MIQPGMTSRIVTFCNADYIPVAENWLRALGEINMDGRATIVSLDDSTRDAFPVNRVLHRPLPPGARGLGALWSHRIEVLREFLSAGEGVIHSDADAVWLRDPLPDIEACAVPIVFSQGTVWPKDVHSQHGLVLCCGFFYLSPVPQVQAFLDAVAGRVEIDRDDQVAVNRVVSDLIEGWDIDNPYEIPFKDTRFIASQSPIRSRTKKESFDSVRIAVLPHHTYPRLLDRVSSETVVAHPLSGKSLRDKVACLSKLGLWAS
ncbi:MAG: hypothetical protein JJU15_20855 [Pararhodobacter sp.]|nr:hypothetical protein [Pararhodobacter sp.]